MKSNTAKFQSSQPALKRTFTEAEAASYTGMSRSFLRQDRMNGQRENRTHGPKYIRIGRSIRYLIEDLDAWLNQFRCASDE
jgi:predicted DNA-binding transcriptional regulator AlpA